MYYFTVAAMFKQEGHILKEWLDHYLLHGVEHFYLINDNSSDNYMEILQPYIEKGLVTLYNYDIQHDNIGRQTYAYNHYLTQHKHETVWMAVLDLDEFLYSPREIDIRKILHQYENYPSIRVNWLHFGSNYHEKQPKNVVQSFTRRASYNTQFSRYISFKPVTQTKYINRFDIHAHNINGKEFIMSDNDSADLIINHYCIQSFEFWTTIKMTRGDVNRYYDSMSWKRDIELFNELDNNDVEDMRLSEQNLKTSIEI